MPICVELKKKIAKNTLTLISGILLFQLTLLNTVQAPAYFFAGKYKNYRLYLDPLFKKKKTLKGIINGYSIFVKMSEMIVGCHAKTGNLLLNVKFSNIWFVQNHLRV